MIKLIKRLKGEWLLIGGLLLISAIAHGYNMFHFPYFENDEGVYQSQAWALLTKGTLAPYTYWYDHAPGGWIFIALWVLLTGGFFTFGFSLNSGRVFMLVLHIVSCVFLYFIGKRVTGSKLVGAISVLIFSLSPLGIYFQRRILLDNIMTFWILFSFFLLTQYKQRLRFIILSAFAFGIAVLSKENAIFFIPVYLYVIFLKAHNGHKHFALITWTSIVFIITSTYFLYAFLKGEFFPAHTFLGGNHDHVSMITTLLQQYGRSGGGIINIDKSTFWQNMSGWLRDDPLIMLSGLLVTSINLFLGMTNKTVRVIGLLSASFWIFLARGGLVIEFYIVPLIPFLALNIATFLWIMQQKVERHVKTPLIRLLPLLTIIIICITDISFTMHTRGNNLYTANQTKPQLEALTWMLKRNTPDSFYVIDNYGYIELHTGKNSHFKNAEWYWKVDQDPDIRSKLLHDHPQDINYIALTPQMEHDLQVSGLNFTKIAWNNSQRMAKFWNDGWGVEFWSTRYPQRILSSSWESYKQHFIKNGRTIDPYQKDITTSEGQSYAMLRAVWMKDKKTFDESFSWTKNYLQRNDTLYSWKYVGSDDTGSAIDRGTATDADEDIALALLFAYKTWHDQQYFTAAQQTIKSIWDKETVTIKGIPYLTAGDWADGKIEVTINPSYLSPAHYRLFADVDFTHPWQRVVDSSYVLVNACSKSPLDKKIGLLPSEWCAIDKNTLTVQQSTSVTATQYGYNAFRVPWRIGLDYYWNREPRAKNYLITLTPLQTDWQTKQRLVAAYQHDGKVWENYESAAAYGGDMGLFTVINPQEADQMYKEKLLAKFYEDTNNSYWDDPKNYYTQNWAWFGTALYTKSIPTL